MADRGALDELKDMAIKYSDNERLVRIIQEVASSPQRVLDRIGEIPEFSAITEDLKRYLDTYYWMSDHDEDIAASHWHEDSTFPLTIFCQLFTAAKPTATTIEDDDIPPMLTKVRRAESARALFEMDWTRLISTIGVSHPLIQLITDLRNALIGKERIHTVYVRLGCFFKILALEQARRWGEQVFGKGAPITDIFHVGWLDVLAMLDKKYVDTNKTLGYLMLSELVQNSFK